MQFYRSAPAQRADWHAEPRHYLPRTKIWASGQWRDRTSDLVITRPVVNLGKYWVRQESNLRPQSYQDCVLPLNYAPEFYYGVSDVLYH